MVTGPTANLWVQLLAQVDALRKHELTFLRMHKQLVDEIVTAGSKYSKFTPGTILGGKGIRYESAVLGRRVDYERKNENAYRRARAAFLMNLRRLGAREQAKYFFDHWKAIERTLPVLEKEIMNPLVWARGAGSEQEQVYKTAEQLFFLQRQIVNALGKIEEMLKQRLGMAVGGKV